MNHPIPEMNERDISRFWGKVTILASNQCWPWTGNTDGKYGKFFLKKDKMVSMYKNPSNKREIKAHRIAYFLAFGVDAGGLDVCHHCDNPPCCNPSHLFIGTRSENPRDMIAKNWRVLNPRKGELNGAARLKEEDVLRIRMEYSSGEKTQRQLASDNGVARSLVSRIVLGGAWSHLPMFELKFKSRKGMNPSAIFVRNIIANRETEIKM